MYEVEQIRVMSGSMLHELWEMKECRVVQLSKWGELDTGYHIVTVPYQWPRFNAEIFS